MSLSTKETGGASNPQRPPAIPRRNMRDTHKSRRAKLPGIVTLARWRARQAWRLLLITGLGIVAAVMLVCAVPLFSDVSQSSGLRGVLSTSYQSSDIVVIGQNQAISKSIIDQAMQKLNAEFQNKLGPYLKPLEFSVHVPAARDQWVRCARLRAVALPFQGRTSARSVSPAEKSAGV